MPHVRERREDEDPRPRAPKAEQDAPAVDRPDGPGGRPDPALPPGAAVPQRDRDDVDPRLVERQTEARTDEILADSGAGYLGDPPAPASNAGRVDPKAATSGRDTWDPGETGESY